LCNVWEPDTLIRSDDSNGEDFSAPESTLYSNPVVSSDNNNCAQILELASGENDHYFSTGKDDGSVITFKMGTAKQHHKLYTYSVSVIEIA
jgi:hypothetical protein